MLKIKEISLADDEELKQWIDTPGQEITEALAVAAGRVRREHYGERSLRSRLDRIYQLL